MEKIVLNNAETVNNLLVTELMVTVQIMNVMLDGEDRDVIHVCCYFLNRNLKFLSLNFNNHIYQILIVFLKSARFIWESQKE